MKNGNRDNDQRIYRYYDFQSIEMCEWIFVFGAIHPANMTPKKSVSNFETTKRLMTVAIAEDNLIFSLSLFHARRPAATSCTATSGSWSAWLRRAASTTSWTRSQTSTSSWTTDTWWSEGRTSPRSCACGPPSCSASASTSSAADTTRWSAPH